VNCIRDYIDLQQLRLSNKTTIEFTSEGDFSKCIIPPMVLMTFIENAFKFGTSNHEESVINIKIEAAGNKIAFFCTNAIFNTMNKERTGIGLLNTKQRLDYLYNEKYELHTDQADGYYTVRLRIGT
jgi:sensor histidine kinase YesM